MLPLPASPCSQATLGTTVRLLFCCPFCIKKLKSALQKCTEKRGKSVSECQESSEKERERERERELRREQRSWCGSNNRGGCTCGVRALDAFIQRVFCYFCRSFVIAETATASAGGGCSGGRTMPPSRSQLLKCSICGIPAGGGGRETGARGMQTYKT